MLPGIDRPRLAAGMALRIELPGYRATRAQAVIDSIGIQVIEPDEAAEADILDPGAARDVQIGTLGEVRVIGPA